nr:hypothetical protein [Brucella abortus]
MSKLTASEKQNLPYKEAHLRGLKEVAARAYGVSLVSESGLYKHTSGGSRRHLSRLDGDEKYTLRINEGIRGNPNATFITRSGINKLISHRRSCDPAGLYKLNKPSRKKEGQKVPELASPRKSSQNIWQKFPRTTSD